MILVIDDSTGFAAVVERTLTRAGYGVEVVNSGAEGIERLAEAALADVPYELALIDYGLPDVDGVEIARIAREHGDRTPFILISGQYDAATQTLVNNRGDVSLADFAAIIGKPMLPAQLVEVVNGITGRAMALPLPAVPVVETARAVGIDVEPAEAMIDKETPSPGDTAQRR